MSKRICLVVGIGNYKYYHSLEYCPDSAAEVYTLLTDPKIGNCDPNVSVLKVVRSGDMLTKSELDALVMKAILQLELNDQFIFFFSGHGETNGNNLYLMLPESERKDWMKSYFFPDIVRYLWNRKITRSIFIVDACHSGAIFNSMKEFQGDWVSSNLPQGYGFLAATGKEESAQLSTELKRTYFSYYLCQGMRCGANTREEHVPLPEIRKYINERINKEHYDITQVARTTVASEKSEEVWLSLNPEYSEKNGNGNYRYEDKFIGRKTELQIIFGRMQTGHSVAIVGEMKMGKSTLLRKIADKKIQKEYLGDFSDRLITVLLDIDVDGLRESFNPIGFWRRIFDLVRDSAGDEDIVREISKVENSNYEKSEIEDFSDFLNRGNYRLLLLFDRPERLLVHPNFQVPCFFALLRSLTSYGGMIMITASSFSLSKMNELGRDLAGDAGSPYFNHVRQYRLHPFDEKTTDEFLSEAGVALEDRPFIRRVAGRCPFPLRELAAGLKEAEGDNRLITAALQFYESIPHYFDDLWRMLDNPARMAIILLGMVELGNRVIEKDFDCHEIEYIDRLGIELQSLNKIGLAEPINEEWNYDRKHALSWQGEKWTTAIQAFTWWIYDVVITETRDVRAYKEWIANNHHIMPNFLNQNQWESLLADLQNKPRWSTLGIGEVSKSLLNDLMEIQK